MVEFKNFSLNKTISHGNEYTILELTIGNIIRKLFSLYKDKRGIHQKYEIVKRSEFDDNSKFGIDGVPDAGLPEYFWIKQRMASTPHGDMKEISYREKGTEQDYKVNKALNVIQKLLEEE